MMWALPHLAEEDGMELRGRRVEDADAEVLPLLLGGRNRVNLFASSGKER